MIGVVDYGMGNLHSIAAKLELLGESVIFLTTPTDLCGVDRVVLPGVGHFAEGMRSLCSSGLACALTDKVEQGMPILGICLGAQLFCRSSEEGGVPGLGWIDAEVRRFRSEAMARPLKIPHMGWNTMLPVADSRLLRNVTRSDFFYFVHSYHLDGVPEDSVAATTSYGFPFVCALERNNVFGTQFHPEKSHACGLTVLQNFLEAQ